RHGKAGTLSKNLYEQACTARLAITVTRWARNSALASPSDCRPSGDTAPASTASAENRAASAVSSVGTRKALPPAPVTATRTPPAVLATITPTTANFDARWANLA